MTPTTTLNPQIVGQAENAHRAILMRSLAAKGISYEAWVALALTVAAGAIDREELMRRLIGALKIEPAVAQATIAGLTSSNLLDSPPGGDRHVRVTSAGQALYSDTRAAIDPIIGRVYGGLPAEDLAIAGRVLTEITARLGTELERPSRNSEASDQSADSLDHGWQRATGRRADS